MKLKTLIYLSSSSASSNSLVQFYLMHSYIQSEPIEVSWLTSLHDTKTATVYRVFLCVHSTACLVPTVTVFLLSLNGHLLPKYILVSLSP